MVYFLLELSVFIVYEIGKATLGGGISYREGRKMGFNVLGSILFGAIHNIIEMLTFPVYWVIDAISCSFIYADLLRSHYNDTRNALRGES